MLFSSVEFVFYFLPIALAASLATRGRLRNSILLALSLVFYAWGEAVGVTLMVGSIVANWFFGRWIGPDHRGRREKFIVFLAVVFNLSLLFFYKYLNFAVENLNVLLAARGASPITIEPIALPIGISFFTFQAMSYVIDVHRKDTEIQKSVFDFGLYISLFPQLIAGPIVRYRDVAAEIANRRVTLEGFAIGSRRFVVGLAKKMLIANTAAATADAIFKLPASQLEPQTAWIGIAAYTLQIYFDFSGYSDMAIGMGRMLGFNFLENFNYPYVARSITDFWRRWHMSLSTWFRDYLYIPLGGNRGGTVRTLLNLVIVFFLCGLWHGAKWTFVVWGLYHGAFLVIERLGMSKLFARTPRIVGHLYTLLVVLVGWVFFRAESLEDAARFLRAMAGFSKSAGDVRPWAEFWTREQHALLLVGALAATPIAPLLKTIFDRAEDRTSALFAAPLRLVRELFVLATHVVLFVFAAAWLASGTHNPFIYFRF